MFVFAGLWALKTQCLGSMFLNNTIVCSLLSRTWLTILQPKQPIQQHMMDILVNSKASLWSNASDKSNIPADLRLPRHAILSHVDLEIEQHCRHYTYFYRHNNSDNQSWINCNSRHRSNFEVVCIHHSSYTPSNKEM